MLHKNQKAKPLQLGSLQSSWRKQARSSKSRAIFKAWMPTRCVQVSARPGWLPISLGARRLQGPNLQRSGPQHRPCNASKRGGLEWQTPSKDLRRQGRGRPHCHVAASGGRAGIFLFAFLLVARASQRLRGIEKRRPRAGCHRLDLS